MRFLQLIFVIFLCVGETALCLAQDAAGSTSAAEIFSTVMSPYCPGRLLSDCPSSEADRLREEIKSSLAGGQSREQVLEDLRARFGDAIRSTPKTEGIGLVGWIMPLVFFAAALIALGVWIVTARR